MTRKLEKDRRVAEILDAAVAEFVEKGYENASIDRIAARAGLTKGGIYYHFKNKDEILHRANERFMEPVVAMIEAALACPTAPDALRCFIGQYLRYWPAHRAELSFVFLTMAKALSRPELAAIYAGYTGPMTGFYSSTYERGVCDGHFRQMDCQAAAVALMCAVDGVIGYLALDSKMDIERTISQFHSAFVDCYLEPPSAVE